MSHKEHHHASSHPKITALKDSIIFQFTDVDVRNGRFVETSASGIYLGSSHDSNAKSARNGKVIAVGPLVEDVEVGNVVLIEPLMWTESFKVDGEMFWKTAEPKVMAIVE
jgi:co-chaperonin GroES (HSP10)